jgi:hypothetical protein
MSPIDMMKVASYSERAQTIEKSGYLSCNALSCNAAFYLFASITLSFLASSSASTPLYSLYSLYQAQWGFSPITVTVIFGIYAISVLAALLFVGRLSDHLGSCSARKHPRHRQGIRPCGHDARAGRGSCGGSAYGGGPHPISSAVNSCSCRSQRPAFSKPTINRSNHSG